MVDADMACFLVASVVALRVFELPFVTFDSEANIVIQKKIQVKLLSNYFNFFRISNMTKKNSSTRMQCIKLIWFFDFAIKIDNSSTFKPLQIQWLLYFHTWNINSNITFSSLSTSQSYKLIAILMHLFTGNFHDLLRIFFFCEKLFQIHDELSKHSLIIYNYIGCI